MIHYMTADGIASPWNANELRRVQLAGIPFTLNALRKPTDFSHEAGWAQEMNDDTVSIYPLAPLRLAASLFLAPILFRGRYFSALFNALFGRRESLKVRFAALVHFFVAAYWALSLRNDKPDHIHSQWAHSGGTVAMYGAWLLNVPFSFTGHAVDLFRQRVALQDKIERADFIVCISNFHRQFYLDQGASPDKLIIVYCGLDLTLFKPVKKSRAEDVFTILSAGRLIEKKGFHHLIDACGLLRDRGLDFKCVIGGSGPQEADLRRLIADRKLDNTVTLTGEALKQERIPEFMASGDVFCLPCVWARDNDVDGLPQLLMEAMACGRPVISTRLVGIPDLVINQETGLLVEPGNTGELADALQFAIQNEAQMNAFVLKGLELLQSRFNLETCLEPLFDKYRSRSDVHS